MKQLRSIIAAVVVLLASASLQAVKNPDWVNHGRYEGANEEVIAGNRRPTAVFMGNSITDFWFKKHPEFFTGNNYVCRGISAQVTTQMLARFRSDVVDLAPDVVVILAGVNDIALNDGATGLRYVVDNIASMADIARWHGITPVICSVLPAEGFGWRPEVTDAPEQIAALNAMLREYCAANNIEYVDYYSRMVTDGGAIDPRYSNDMVHPTPEGYAVMEPVITEVIGRVAGR